MTSTKELSYLFDIYAPDKITNGYLEIYQPLFFDKRKEVTSLLHIVRDTKSSNLWSNIFPNAKIITFNTQFTKSTIHNESILKYNCNPAIKSEVKEIMDKFNEGFDVIIDEGSDHDIDQIHTINNLYPYIKRKGIYVTENVNPISRITSYPTLIYWISGVYPMLLPATTKYWISGVYPMLLPATTKYLCVINRD